jgi:hypothetical protein
MVGSTLPCGVIRNNAEITILMQPCLFNPRGNDAFANARRAFGLRGSRKKEFNGAGKRKYSDEQSPDLYSTSPRRKVSDASMDAQGSAAKKFKCSRQGVRSGIFFNNIETSHFETAIAGSGVYFNNQETRRMLHPLQSNNKSNTLAFPRSRPLPSGIPLHAAPALLQSLKMSKPLGPISQSLSEEDRSDDPQVDPPGDQLPDHSTAPLQDADPRLVEAALALSEMGKLKK